MTNILEHIVNSSKSFIRKHKLTLTTIGALFAMNSAMSQEFGDGDILLTTADNQTSEYTLTGEQINGTFSEVKTGTLETPLNYAQWPLASLGVEGDRLKESIIQGPSNIRDFTAYAKFDNNRNVKAFLFDTQGRTIGKIQANPASNGYTQLFYNGTSLSEGIYIAKITAGDQSVAFQVPLTGESRGTPWQSRQIQQSSTQSSSAKNMFAKTSTTAKGFGPVNYTITVEGEDINNTSFDVEVVAGTNPTIEYTVVGSNGDFGVLPEDENASAVNNATINVENLTNPSKSYTKNTQGTGTAIAAFENAWVSSASGPDQYKITITSNDGTFLPTKVTENIEQDINGEVNGLKRIMVNKIPNEQDITIKTINTTSLNPESNVRVFMKENGTNNVLQTIESDENGNAAFSDVAGQTNVYFAVEGTTQSTNIYSTSRGTYSVPEINNIKLQDTVLYYSVKEKISEVGNIIPGDTINAYKPIVYNVRALAGKDELYFDPNDPLTSTQIQHLQNGEAVIGKQLFVYNTTTPYSTPTPEQVAQYENRAPNQNNVTGIIGSNITSTGTNTTMKIETLSNGETVLLYSSECRLGGSDESDNQHEGFGRRLNHPDVGGASFTNSSGSSNAVIGTYEGKIIKYYLDDGFNYFHNFDSENRSYNYSTLTETKTN